jgi:hypothetical protein
MAVSLYLTKPQYSKFSTGKSFQVSYQQLNDPDHTHGDHHCEIHIPKKEYTKLQRNIRQQKGFRFKAEHILGGGLFDIIKKVASNPMVQQIGKTALQKGLSMASNSNNAYISGAANMGQKLVGGNGFKKGSQEAKDRMQHVRSMRKKGAGFGSFMKTVGRIAKNPLVRQIGSVALKTALTAAKLDPATAPLAMVAQSALSNQKNTPSMSSPVGNGLRHKRMVNDCSPIVGGTPMPIHLMRGKKIDGGSFKEL